MADYDEDDERIVDKKPMWSLPSDVVSVPAAPVAPAVPKKPEGPSALVADDLKVGMHVKLKCNCEGFIKKVHISEDSREDRWFSVIHTKMVCQTRTKESLEKLYSEFGADSRIETYHNDSFRGVLPAFESPAPEWFKTMSTPPVNANSKRIIRVRLGEGMELMIPGCLATGRAHSIASVLRTMMPSAIDIEVVETKEPLAVEAMTPAVALLQSFAKAEVRPIKDRNASILFNYILASILEVGEGVDINLQGTNAVSREAAREVLASILKHPVYRGNMVTLNSSDGYVVTLGMDGKIQ